MIVPQDEEALKRLLGVNEVPDNVKAEYEIRIGMFHRGAGERGPLGGIGLVDMLRSLGLCSPQPHEKENAGVDWRSLPTDGSIRIEAKYFGGWQPGIYLGLVQWGTLAIRLDEDVKVKECRKDRVRLATCLEMPSEAEKFAAGVAIASPRAKLLEQKPEVHPPAPETEVEPEEVDESVEEDTAEEVDSDADTVVFKAGDAVWVSTDDDVVNGQFVGVAENGRYLVHVDGSEQGYEAHLVVPVR
jgi:hypothetical protein